MESCRSIDVTKLEKAGCLRPGWSGCWQWTEEGRQVAWIQLRAEERRLRLVYRIQIRGGEWEYIDVPVRIAHSACRLGGCRHYFICPGVVNEIPCQRRVVKLYGAGRYFLCRHCYRLAHASQSEDCLDGARRRANRIRHRLGGEAGMLSRFPDRPKGMWHRTFDRLRKRAIDAEMQAEEMFEVQAERLIARLDRRYGKGSFWS